MHPVARFGSFELDLRTRELRNRGIRVHVRQQPAEILVMLVERPGEILTREEIRERLWPDGTVVEFEHSINAAVNRLRDALGDSPGIPRYIETLPRRGYRFIGGVEISRPTAIASGPEPAAGPELPETAAIDKPPRPVRAETDAVQAATGILPRRRAWLIAAGVAAVVLAVAGWRWMGHGPEGSGRALHPVQMTTSRALDIWARFSPDGNAFVYSSNRSGKFEVYRRAIVPNGPDTPITNDGKQNLQPAWSPDGAWIAYHSVVEGGIRVVPAAGGTPRRLTAFGSDPAWSPDGRHIAFCSTEPQAFTWLAVSGVGPTTIWVVGADGSQLRRLTTAGTPPGPHGMPDWSPDGRRVVFVGGNAIWSLDPGSGKSEMLVKADRDLPQLSKGQPARLADPKFHPSGEGLYFSAATPDGEYAIYRLLRSGERLREIHATRHELPSGMAFSPDGKCLLFTAMSHISRLAILKPGAEPLPLFEEAVTRLSLPSFSPDGKHLAFSVEAGGRNREVWIMNPDGKEARKVSGDPGSQGSGITWNRQGQLLYRYSEGSQMEFRRYDPVRKTTEAVFSRPAPRTVFYPLLMPDEQELLSTCSTPENICLTALAGGKPREITKQLEGATFPFVSHDGEWVVYHVRRGEAIQIGITDRLGRRQEILTDDPGVHWAYSFSSDNRRIAYAAYREGVWNIWWIDRITRERRQLTHYTAYGPFVRSPAWRPGTDEVVYEQTEAKGNVYMLALR